MSWILPFCMGFSAAVLIWVSWRMLQLYLDLKITRRDTERAELLSKDNEIHASAWKCVADCRKRMLYAKQINPKWVEPLIDEVPKLVRAIATIYHPDEPEPLHGPKLSEFTRAIELTSADISNFLQQRRAGRLVDLSAGKAWRTWEKTRDLTNHPKIRKIAKAGNAIYDRMRPVVQILRYKSPITWASIAVSNAAARTLQPAVINIVGHRAIQLYSGEFRRKDSKEDLPPLEMELLDIDEDESAIAEIVERLERG